MQYNNYLYQCLSLLQFLLHTIQFTRLVLRSLYLGLPFSWRCEVEIPGNQLPGVTADVEWRGPGGAVITSDSRITVGATTRTISWS